MGFFTQLSRQYGANTVQLLKQWANTNIKLASSRNRRIFLLACRKHGITPNHINNNTKNITNNIQYQDGRMGQRISSFGNRLDSKILNIEITVTHNNLRSLETSFTQLSDKINNILPLAIWSEFQNRQKIHYERAFQKIKTNNLNKLNRLLNNEQNKIKTKECWVKDLSGIDIPTDILQFLALGFKFSLSPNSKDVSIKRLLADIENMMFGFLDEKKNIVRAKITNILTNFMKTPQNNDYLNLLFTKTKKFLKQHNELIVTRSDKGNVTVILPRALYIEKSNDILLDQTYYKQLRQDPTSTFQQKSNKFVSMLKNKGELSEDQAKQLTIYNHTAPKFYGLPKIHKPTLTVRPIISSINSPNSKLSQLITNILTESYNRDNEYYTRDSFDFAEFINETQLPDNYEIISLDVVSLFSNIPYYLLEKSIKNRWDNIKTHTNLSKTNFLKITEFIFDSTYCVFQDTYYKQILGTPMGATISPIAAQYIMDDLLNECIPKLPFQLPFLKKYVDDIICAIPSDQHETILNTFNSFHMRIQFTIEREQNRSVPFLDTKLIRNDNNQIILDWYVKPTNSGRYVNYHSYHTEKIKINLVLALKTRVEKISHPTLRDKNLKILYNTLLENSYPEKILKKLIFNTRPANDVQRGDGGLPSPDISIFLTENQPIYYFSIPYIKEVTTKILKVFRDERNIKVVPRYSKTVGLTYTKLKDKDPPLKQSEVVYRIPCSGCDKSYIGQTSRVLKDRITQHKSDCRLKKQTCALAQHSTETEHEFNFANTSVLIGEKSLRKRLFLEMVAIHQHNRNTINKKKDIGDLSAIYSYLLDLDLNNGSQTTPEDNTQVFSLN